MKQFSAKNSAIIAAVSIVVLLCGAALVLFSRGLMDTLYEFLAQTLFRTKNVERWRATIYRSLFSVFLAPIFLVVAANAIIFPKYNGRTKIALLSVLAAVMFFSIAWTLVSVARTHGDSDMASELLLAKECVREGAPVLRDWYYSTEIRLLHTQLISAPLFLFTQDWYAVRVGTSLACCALLALATFFLLRRLKIESKWLVLFCCVLAFSPWSGIIWEYVVWGGYYAPHVVISMIYIAAFVKIADSGGGKARAIFFYAWAFISGLCTIRYLLFFTFPLALACLAVSLADAKRSGAALSVKGLWQGDARLRAAALGFAASGAGYVCNALVLPLIYSFLQLHTTTAFNTLGDTTLLDIFRATIQMFGWQDNIAVLTPGGILNLLIYAAIVFFIVCAIASWKRGLPYSHRIMLAFFAASFLFNAFVFIHTEFSGSGRYLYPILIYIVPCLAILLSNKTLSAARRHVLGAVWAVVLICSSFATMQTQINAEQNSERRNVTRFLEDAGYTFGYATFWNANITTYLTNGKIEVGEMAMDNGTYGDSIIDHYEYYGWLTPRRYYGADYDARRMFFLVTREEYEKAPNPRVFENGTLVYEDEWFKVFDYASVAGFKAAFEGAEGGLR